jgi:hypothetical protein
VVRGIRIVAAAAMGLALSAAEAAAQGRTDALVSLRYAGRAGGEPELNDLAAIKAIGFDAVAWPESRAAEAASVKRLADLVGLSVVVMPSPVPLTAARARTPGRHVDVRAGDADARVITPLAWRAIAHGARSIAFDPDSGLARPDGTAARWLAPAVAIARHLSANRRLVEIMQPGPALRIDAADAADLDVVLLDGGRAWVIVATNLSASPARARVTFPRGVPSGLWASWLDDSAMSMLYQPSGSVWSVELEGLGTKVYFIDKIMKLRTQN